MSVGERICELRKQNGISQYQLAKIMGVSRQAVSKWETGQSSPDTVNLIQLADILNTEVEYLAAGKKPEHPSPAVVTVEKVVDRVVEVEKIVEKPVIVEKRVKVEKIVEKPVIRKVYRNRYFRNPIEYGILGLVCFLFGLLIGFFI